MIKLHLSLLLLALCALPLVGCGSDDNPGIFVDPDPDPVPLTLDEQLRIALGDLQPIDPGGPFDPALVHLGQMLMFDKEMSGNRDTSCATCHHPTLGIGDALSLSIGTGATPLGALGGARSLGEGRQRVPRNAPEVFNRGAPEFIGMFWDSRVFRDPETGEFSTPAGAALPDGIDSALAAQAMFPPTSPAEMRGNPGDLDVFGNPNELGEIDAMDFTAIWNAIVARFKAIPGYVDLFQQAFPGVALDDIGMQHIGNAIAAFEADAWAFNATPFDAYLAGSDEALTEAEKRGALLFFGKAKCSECHSGAALTDMLHHNVALPQVGGGRAPDNPLDLGRFRVTDDPADKYKFRTPPLRNTSITGPWMHNGCFTNLEQVVRHYNDGIQSLIDYDPTILAPEFHATHVTDPAVVDEIIAGTDERLAEPLGLTEDEINDLVTFLTTGLLDPNAIQGLVDTVPDTVPSGLPVDR